MRHRGRGRVAVNIGGIANLTAIPPNTSTDRVIAFDTGPGNMVIDQLVSRITSGGQTYDRDGAIAASGVLDPKLLAKLLRDKYFAPAAQNGWPGTIRRGVRFEIARYGIEQ